MNYTPVPSTFYQPALHSTSFQSPAPNHQQLVPFFKKHRCSYCYYSSDRAFDLKKHQTRKHSDLISMDGERHVKSKHKEIKNYNMEKMVLLCGNCELITTCIDEMIRHKKDEHNIIYSQNSLEHSLINAGKGEGGEESGEKDGGMEVGEGDVI